MVDNLITFGILLVSYLIMFYTLSFISNYGNYVDIRRVGLLKYKNGKKIRYKIIVADKFILKEFIYTRKLEHMNLRKYKTSGILSIYFFDRELNLYEFNGRVCKKVDEEKYDKLCDDVYVTFLNIYNYMAINRFIGKLLFKIDDIKNNKESIEEK